MATNHPRPAAATAMAAAAGVLLAATLSCRVAAAAPPPPPPSAGGVPHLTGDAIMRRVVEGDEAYGMLVLASDDRCGKMCADIKDNVAKVLEAGGGLINMGYINSHDTTVGADGDSVDAYRGFNITNIPTLFMYGVGPKRLESGLQLGPDTAWPLLRESPKTLYASMRTFVPSAVAPVRATSLAEFFTAAVPGLPRVVFLSTKREVSLIAKKLSTDFAPRAFFGQAGVDDADLAAAFGVAASDAPLVLVSPPGATVGIALNGSTRAADVPAGVMGLGAPGWRR